MDACLVLSMAQPGHRIQFNRPGSGGSSAVLNLLIANGVFFVLQLISQSETPSTQPYSLVDQWLSLMPLPGTSPYQLPPFYPWQLLTYGFLHGSFPHILINMFVLWTFGTPVAKDLGERRFLVYYLICIVGAGVCQLLMPFVMGDGVPVVGASGGTFGVLLAFGWRYPQAQIMLLFPPIPMKARTAVVVFGAMELYFGVTGLRTGIAHFAHLGGLVTGIVMLLYWRGKLPLKPKDILY